MKNCKDSHDGFKNQNPRHSNSNTPPINNDSIIPLDAIIVTSSEQYLDELRDYCAKNNLRIIKYFGTPENITPKNTTSYSATIYSLTNFIINRQQKTVTVLDDFASLGRIYHETPFLDELTCKNTIEIHAPLQDMLIKAGEFSAKNIKWYIFVLLAEFYSLHPPKTSLNPCTEEQIYYLTDEIINGLEITSELQEVISEISKTAIDCVIAENESLLTDAHEHSLNLSTELLQMFKRLMDDDITKEQYGYECRLSENLLTMTIYTIQVNQQTVNNFRDAVLRMQDIAVNGRGAFINASYYKKRRLINLMFSRLELKRSKLDFTLRPAFALFFKKLPPK